MSEIILFVAPGSLFRFSVNAQGVNLSEHLFMSEDAQAEKLPKKMEEIQAELNKDGFKVCQSDQLTFQNGFWFVFQKE